MSDLFHKPLPPEARANLQPEILLTEQIACVKRELAMRVRVYAYRVRERKMTQQHADREIDVMTAVLHTLEDLARAGIIS